MLPIFLKINLTVYVRNQWLIARLIQVPYLQTSGINFLWMKNVLSVNFRVTVKSARHTSKGMWCGDLPLVVFTRRDFSLSVYSWMKSKLLLIVENRNPSHFLVMGYWGCAAEWGHIFTIELTVIGSPFQVFLIELLELGRTFKGLWD